MRVAVDGFLGRIFARLGASVTPRAGVDLADAFSRGRIDAAIGGGPADADATAIAAQAPVFCYPGLTGSRAAHFVFDAPALAALPPEYRAMIEAAAAMASRAAQARFDADNPPAIEALYKSGVKLAPLPRDVTSALYDANLAAQDEEAANSPAFKAMQADYVAFRNSQYLWQQAGDHAYDRLLIHERAHGG